MNEILLAIITGAVILLGIAGAILPFLPGLPLSLAALIIYGFMTDFSEVTVLSIVIFSILTVLTIVVDIFAPALGTRGYKSTKWGTWGAFIGMFGGVMVFGPIGALIGPFVGAFIGEYLKVANVEHALRIAYGAFIGMVIGSVFKIVVGFSMFIYFLIAIL